MKRLIVVLTLLIAINFSLAYAQQNQTESLSITTYFPSPYGVYRTLLFSPNNLFVPDSDCVQEGATSFNNSTHELYTCKGSPLKWKKLGGSLKVFSDHGLFGNGPEIFSPDQCNSTLVHAAGVPPTGGDPLCSEPFYMDITFLDAFSSPPQVIVSAENFNSWLNKCSTHDTDKIAAYATNVTETGFRLWAGASTEGHTCDGPSGEDYSGYFTQAGVGWMAIGE